MMTWQERRKNAEDSLGRKLTLDEALKLSIEHEMTPEEIEEQRQSWARANISTGDPRFD